MSEHVWPKLGGFAAISAGILLIVGFIVGPSGSPPGFDDSAREVQSWLQENRGEIQGTLALGFLTLVALTVFLGAIYERLRRGEPGPRISAAALAGGIVTLAAAIVGSGAELAAVYHVETLGADTVLGLWDLSVLGFLFVWAGFGVLAGATALLGMRARVLPDWHAYLSAAASAYVLVVGLISMFSETGAFSPSDGALNAIGFIVFVVWLLATGVALLREPAAASAAVGGRTAAPEPMG
jgi:hypothetical protein